MELKREGIRGWLAVFLFSIAGTVFGFLLVLHPFKGISALMVLMGITLILDGIENICFAVYVAKYINKIRPIDSTGRFID